MCQRDVGDALTIKENASEWLLTYLPFRIPAKSHKFLLFYVNKWMISTVMKM
jgi:hypothetical protein